MQVTVATPSLLARPSRVDYTFPMTREELTQLVSQLSAEEQTAVREFITFLKRQDSKSATFAAAIDEFVAAHPDLLRRLAQ